MIVSSIRLKSFANTSMIWRLAILRVIEKVRLHFTRKKCLAFMGGDEGVAKWIVDKLTGDGQFSTVASVGSGFLELARKDSVAFTAVAIGVQDLITRDHVAPLFAVEERQPQFVVNVPSKAIWLGAAIDFIHAAPAAFGTFGELIRASRAEPVSSYRHREY